VWSFNTSIAPPGCPTKRGELSPGDDIGNSVHILFLYIPLLSYPYLSHLPSFPFIPLGAVNYLHLSCEGGGEVAMQACFTLGTEPFDLLNSTYRTLEFYFIRGCEGT